MSWLWSRGGSGNSPGLFTREEEKPLSPDAVLRPARRCTDLLCALLFVVYMAGMLACGVYASQEGDPRRLTHGFNYAGLLCGVDEAVAHQRYLFFCPQDTLMLGSGESVPTSIAFTDPICLEACPTSDRDLVHCPTATRVETVTTGEYPDQTSTTTIVRGTEPKQTYATRPIMNLYCVPKIPSNSTLAKSMLEGPMSGPGVRAMEALGSLRRTAALLAAASVLALILGYAYLFTLRTFAAPLVWSLLVVVILGSFAAAGYCAVMALGLDLPAQVADHVSIKNLAAEVSAEHAATINWALAATFGLVGFLVLVLTCFGRRRIQTAVACVRAACAAVFGMPSLLLEPALEAGVKLAATAALLLGGMWLASVGDLAAHETTIGGKRVAGVHRSFTYKPEEKYMLVYYLFGSFWLLEALTALGQFIVCYAVVTWFFTPRDQSSPALPLLRGAAVATRYHLGTLAVGAFLIALVRLVRAGIALLMRQQKLAGNNPLVGAVLKALMCCVSCFERFMKFVNKNAYIDVAMNSNNFWQAAKNSFTFILENTATIGLLNGATFVFEAVGVLSIAGGCGALTFILVTHHEAYTSNHSAYFVASPELVAGVATLLAAVVAASFMKVFDMAADTLLYCYTYAKKHNPSNLAKFAPTELQELCSGPSQH